nr:helicase-related protein [Planctomycetota bacterium]
MDEPSISSCEALLPRVPVADAVWAEGRLRVVRQRAAAGKPIDRGLRTLAERLKQGADLVQRRGDQAVTIAYPEDLPVSGEREQVLELLRTRRVVVLTGETGSGKTTQLPKMLLEAGFGRRGMIAVTQPRRVAAVAVAARLREEMQAADETVVHSVRFDDHATDLSLVRVMTDGLLLAEASRDRSLLRYDALIIDEAHERSLNIDVLLGLARRLLDTRPELRVVVTSATIDAERFARYFDIDGTPAPMVAVGGRAWPVEQRYLPPADEDLGYLSAAVQALQQLHQEEAGDVLCFLPTERDILEARRRLQSERGMTVLPLFGRLTPAEQQRVFAPARGRKVVLATNIAETSITVPGIRYVVDAGMARIKRYSASARTERLPVEPVAKASLRQRAGRAGRTGPGICIRLFDEQDAEGRADYT